MLHTLYTYTYFEKYHKYDFIKISYEHEFSSEHVAKVVYNTSISKLTLNQS